MAIKQQTASRASKPDKEQAENTTLSSTAANKNLSILSWWRSLQNDTVGSFYLEANREQGRGILLSGQGVGEEWVEPLWHGCLPLRAMLPFRHIAVEMKSLTGPFRAGPATDPWARTDPFRKVIFTLLHIEGVCASLCARVGRGHRRGQCWVGCERQKWWAENEERRRLFAYILDVWDANAPTCDAKNSSAKASCLLNCFGYVLCGWMKVIHSERGRQCIHRAEIMLLFGYLCSP